MTISETREQERWRLIGELSALTERAARTHAEAEALFKELKTEIGHLRRALKRARRGAGKGAADK